VTTLLAFLHHAGAFALVAALTAELVLLRSELTLRSARKVRAIVHTELAGIVLIVLFAAMMARGVGFFG
jgi:uncharacterized membrane protein